MGIEKAKEGKVRKKKMSVHTERIDNSGKGIIKKNKGMEKELGRKWDKEVRKEWIVSTLSKNALHYAHILMHVK